MAIKFELRRDEPSEYMLRVRMTNEEERELRVQSAAAGLTLSEYTRRRTFGRPVISRTDETMLAELRRVGGLLKHIHNESKGAYSADTAMALDDVREAIKAIVDRSKMGTDEYEAGDEVLRA